MTKGFMSGYQMHSLLPDEVTMYGGRTLSLQEMVFSDAKNLVPISEDTMQTFLWLFAHTPQQVRYH